MLLYRQRYQICQIFPEIVQIYPSRAAGCTPVLLCCGVRVAHRISFLCRVVVLFVFILYLVLSVARVSCLPMLDCPFDVL
jgi:hypothetical protein